MSYCSSSDLAREFSGISFTSETKVTSGDIAAWILEADAEIDGYLSGVYLVPITGTESLKIIKSVCIKLVSHRIERKLRIESNANELNSGRQTDLRSSALKTLMDIRKGDLDLKDATKATSHDGAASLATTVDTTVEHTFKKGEDQW